MSTTNLELLLVDDDPAIQRLLAFWLRQSGYEVRLAGNGREAIEAIEACPPHVLITDWEMPEVNGIELCTWLRQQELPHYVYTVFLSVRDDSQTLIQGLDAGADDFLKKPVDRGELIARLQAGSRLIELESRLSRLAKCDALTELPTQRTFYEFMNREWSRCDRNHLPLSCVMCDIDFFKRINDTLGHPVGDEVIRHVASVLASNCRASDVVSRYGGEEFCVLLPETDENSAARWADRIRQKIADIDLGIDSSEMQVTASFGVAQRLDDTHTPEQLVDLADQALLVAKRSGRDRVVSFQSINQNGRLETAQGGPAAIFGGLVAKDVMTTIVAGLNQDDLVGRAAQYFLRFRINSAPVVNQNGEMVGILSEKDVMSIMLGSSWWETKIRDVMKSNVVCYEEDAPVLSIYEFLCRVSIRGVIVANCGKPTGVITRGSLLRWFTNSIGTDEETTESPERQTHCQSEAASPRERLEMTSLALATETAELLQRLRHSDEDLVPCVVGGASRMQELVNDLLAYSRYADEPFGDQGSRENDPHHTDGIQQGLAGILGKSFPGDFPN